MDLQSKTTFYFQLIFIIIAFFLSLILNKKLKAFIAKKTVSPIQKFKVILLGLYVHIEPHLFFLILLTILSFGYSINYISEEKFLSISIAQIIVGLSLVLNILIKYCKK
tara:strand:+ start:5655 stop:5981 length:327 start_codon:yes stop_codon:yes gene_type:complete